MTCLRSDLVCPVPHLFSVFMTRAVVSAASFPPTCFLVLAWSCSALSCYFPSPAVRVSLDALPGGLCTDGRSLTGLDVLLALITNRCLNSHRLGRDKMDLILLKIIQRFETIVTYTCIHFDFIVLFSIDYFLFFLWNSENVKCE